MVYVKKKDNETQAAMIRRFTRRIQQSGILIRARKMRFYDPKPTKRAVKDRALRKVRIVKEREHLAKLGRLPEEEQRYQR